MDIVGTGFINTLLVLESRKLSYGNFMFIDNIQGLFYPEKIDWSKEPALEDASRNQMFEDGLKLDKEGRKLEALKRYLKCLVGLKENSRFALLPQCLRNVSINMISSQGNRTEN